MDIKTKLTRNFFRSEIKNLAEILKHDKLAFRKNQSIDSKGTNETHIEYMSPYGKWGWILNKKEITALHIAYAELRSKIHLSQEKRKLYVYYIEKCIKRLEEHLEKEQNIDSENKSIEFVTSRGHKDA